MGQSFRRFWRHEMGEGYVHGRFLIAGYADCYLLYVASDERNRELRLWSETISFPTKRAATLHAMEMA